MCSRLSDIVYDFETNHREDIDMMQFRNTWRLH